MEQFDNEIVELISIKCICTYDCYIKKKLALKKFFDATFAEIQCYGNTVSKLCIEN